MKQLLSLFVALFCVGLITAQDLEKDYEGVYTENELPKDVITKSSVKYRKDAQSIKKSSDKRKVRKDKDKFYLQNNFIIDNLLRSGDVLFDDPMTRYVNKVADKLLEDDPSLRKELDFYVVKSVYANAFATDRGSIFINTGLLNVLEDEAQLAFILAHEIVHYEEKHVIKTYVENKRIQRDAKGYSRAKVYEQLLKKSEYSIDIEKEADEHGFHRYEESKYAYASLLDVFNILDVAHASWSRSEFDQQQFNFQDMVFDTSFFLLNTQDVQPMSEKGDDDANEEAVKTHPDIEDRNAEIAAHLAGKSDVGRSKFLVSEEEFNKVQQLSRFVSCESLVQARRYQAALYYATSLKEFYPDNKFLDLSICKSLYGLSKYRMHKRKKEVEFDYEKVEGPMQQAYYFVSKLEDEELISLTASELYRFSLEHPADNVVPLLLQNLMNDAVAKEFVEKPSKYYVYKKADLANGAKTDIDSLLAKREEVEIAKFAFGEYANDVTLKNVFKAAEKYKKEYDKYNDPSDAEKKRRRKVRKRINNRGYELGLDKVLVVNPYYLNLDERGKDGLHTEFIETEVEQESFNKLIAENGKKLKLNTKILDSKALRGKNSLSDFNDITKLNNWMYELDKHGSKMNFIPSNYTEVQEVLDRHGMEHVAFMGAINLIEKEYNASNIMLGIIIPYYLPFAIYDVATLDANTLYFCEVYDHKRNGKVMSHTNYIALDDKKAISDSNVYYSLYQIKKQPKK